MTVDETRDRARERRERAELEYEATLDPGGDLLWHYFEGTLAQAGAALVWLAPLGNPSRMVSCVSAHCTLARRFDSRGAPALERACCPHCGRTGAECWTLPCLELSTLMARGSAAKINAWLETVDAPFRVGESN